MPDITPIYPLLSAKEKVFLLEDAESFDSSLGGLRGNATSIQQGEGDDVFKVDHRGLWLGNSEFADAPFSVSMAGVITGVSLDVESLAINNLFFVDTDGNMWSGATTLAAAPFSVTNLGAVAGSSFTITGGDISGVSLSGIPNDTSTDISLLEMSHDLVFSVTDADTIAWATGTINLSNGRTFSIDAGNTGNMAALTYIYLDPVTSATVLQVTTTYSTAVGADKRLIGTAQNETTTASFVPFGPGKALLDGDNIGALSILAGQIAANSVVASKISVTDLAAISADFGAQTAGTITLDSTGHIKSVQSDFNTGGKGFFLGFSSSAPKFSIGDSADTLNQMTWDDTELLVNGSALTGGFLYGSGTDGDVTISGATSLTEDKYYDNVTVNTGVHFDTAGYKIFIKGTLTLTGSATIGRTGTVGGNGTNGVDGGSGGGGGTGGALAASQAAGTLVGTIAGKIAPNGASGGDGANHNGVNGGAGDNVTPRAVGVAGAAGAVPGVGGDGAQTGGTAGAGGAGGTVTATSIITRPVSLPQAVFYADYDPQAAAGTTDPYQGSAASGVSGQAGGGGGNAGTGADGGGGGGGGACGGPGGTAIICARIITGDGSVTVQGGAGGTGGDGGDGQTSQNTGGGGGGAGGSGGPGGVLVLVYSNLASGVTVSVAGGEGGTGGAKGAPGDGTDNATAGGVGITGTTGTKIEIPY